MNINGPEDDDEDDTPLLDEVIVALILNGSNIKVGVWKVDNLDKFIDDLCEEECIV